jgi:hypothetical protein
MMSRWLILAVIFYPITALPSHVPWVIGLAKYSALASGLIVALVLWLYALPRDLAWTFPIDIAPRFALPLTGYLAGLAVSVILMHWATEKGA